MNLSTVMKDCDEKMKKSVEMVQHEMSTIRTGKANPALVEGLQVSCYGSMMRLKEVAGISVPEARTLVIQPWDPSQIAEIEKAIQNSNLGITPANDGKVIRLNLPDLTEERRKDLIKVVRKMAEDGRVTLRNIRRDINAAIQKLLKDAAIAEDEKFNSEKKVQEKTDHYIKSVDELLKHKEQEILKV